MNQKRFQNNTVTVPIDRRRVYGFMPVKARMNPLNSNQQSEVIGTGQLVLFNPRNDRTVDADWKQARQEFSATHFANAVASQFRDGGQGDEGFRILDFLTPLEYNENTGEDEADRYFAIVHPPLHAIGRKCPMGLEDEPDGENYDLPIPCPSCRVEWLQSIECGDERLGEVAVANELQKDILTNLRDTLIKSYQAGRNFHRSKLADTDADIMARSNGQNGKGAYQDVDYYFAATLHKKAPHLEQADAMAESARITGEAIGKNIGGNNSVGDPTAGMSNIEKAQYYAEKAEFEEWKRERDSVQAAAIGKEGVTPVLPPEIAPQVILEAASELLEPIAMNIPVRVLATGDIGVVRGKPGGRYTVEFADESKTFTRAEIAKVKEDSKDE